MMESNSSDVEARPQTDVGSEKNGCLVQVSPQSSMEHANQNEHLRRSLSSRQASMLALGGAIGTGLIVGSGSGLANTGPVGLLIAYAYVGSLCYAMLTVGPPEVAFVDRCLVYVRNGSLSASSARVHRTRDTLCGA